MSRGQEPMTATVRATGATAAISATTALPVIEMHLMALSTDAARLPISSLRYLALHKDMDRLLDCWVRAVLYAAKLP